jgi:hypothetical protein
LEKKVSKDDPHHEEDAEINATFIGSVQKWGLQNIS